MVRVVPNPVSDFANLLSKFERFCLVDLQLSCNTVKRHHVIEVKRFLQCVKKDPYSIDDNDIREYLIKFKDEPWTYKNIVSALRRFFRDYLRKSEVISSFKLPNINYEPKTIPSKKELNTFYDYLPNLKQRTIFLLLASSGLRIGELQSLTKEDVDLERKMIIPRNHKGNTKKSWISFFNQETYKILKEYLMSRNDGDEKLIPFNLANI